MSQIVTDICIVGGGPAGVMLGYLLAKLGVEVVVLEKATHYQRNFRGESISPDTVAIFEENNLLQAISDHGYVPTTRMELLENGKIILQIDFNKFKYKQKYTIDLPQSSLIKIILSEAEKYKNFTHIFESTCKQLIIKNDKVIGLDCISKQSKQQIFARLVVGADGRYGKVRTMAKLEAKIIPLARDILWFLLPRPDSWGNVAKIALKGNQHMIILPTYPDQLRVGVNIIKDSYREIRKQSIEVLYKIVSELEPSLSASVSRNIQSWSDVTLLDIFTMQLPHWSKDGLVIIGDAAHTLTPVLGQGVNHAIKDAILLAPIIANYLNKHSEGVIPSKALQQFENERKKDVNIIHDFQVRQEKLMNFSGAIKTMIRRNIYRIMNSSSWLQKKAWGKILYGYQQKIN